MHRIGNVTSVRTILVLPTWMVFTVKVVRKILLLVLLVFLLLHFLLLLTLMLHLLTSGSGRVQNLTGIRGWNWRYDRRRKTLLTLHKICACFAQIISTRFSLSSGISLPVAVAH
jgi:hypothetical protein